MIRVKKRVIFRDDKESKNYSDVTHVKKRPIAKREYGEIEGSKPKKIFYGKEYQPRMVVMVNT